MQLTIHNFKMTTIEIRDYAEEKARFLGVLSGKFVSMPNNMVTRFRFQVMKWNGLNWVVDDSRHVFVLTSIHTHSDGSTELTHGLCCVFQGPYNAFPTPK